jgi:hypothetical protein
MTTLTSVNSKPQFTSAWNQSKAIAPKHQPNVISSSRSITEEDEVYLRDYTIAAAIISWDEGTYGTSVQVTAADITNIALADDTVWYQINHHRAIPLHIETFHSHRLQIQQQQANQDKPEQESQQQQPVGIAGDSVAYQLRPNQQVIAEFEQGCAHGRLDAAEGLHPIYAEATCPYSAGYLSAYNNFLNPTQPMQQPETSQQAEWLSVYDPNWDWYQVWVGDRVVGRASNHKEAERIAQKHIADEKFWQQHRQAVLAAYSE